MSVRQNPIQSALMDCYTLSEQMAGPLNNPSNMDLPASMGPGQGVMELQASFGRNSSLGESQRSDVGESSIINPVMEVTPPEGNEIRAGGALPVQEASPSRRDAEHREPGGDSSSSSQSRFRSHASTEDDLTRIATLVVEKARNETPFSASYAELCHLVQFEFYVIKENHDNGQVRKVSFRKFLLQKCQSEFERFISPEAKNAAEQQAIERQQKLKAARTEQEKKELHFEFDGQDVEAKRRAHGLVRFLGELYNLSMLSFNVMHDCFCKLMMNPMDFDSIECACILFRTIGKKFADDADAPPKRPDEVHKRKDKYIEVMDNLHKILREDREAPKQGGGTQHMPRRLIFMLEDIWELKERNWAPRHGEQGEEQPRLTLRMLDCLKTDQGINTLERGGIVGLYEESRRMVGRERRERARQRRLGRRRAPAA